MNHGNLTDEERIDPTRAVRWLCARGSYSTIVVAVSRDEAKAVAGYWFARASQRGPGVSPIDISGRWDAVRPATDEEAARWVALRSQDRAEPRSLRTGVGS